MFNPYHPKYEYDKWVSYEEDHMDDEPDEPDDYYYDNSSNINTMTFNTKIVGVTHYDQSVIRSLKRGQTLRAVREPNNPYDRNAIAVYYKNTIIGHLSKELAEKFARELDRGNNMNITVNEVTGAEYNRYGVNVKISFNKIYDECEQLVADGDKYFYGKGVNENNNKAFDYYMEAAKKGYAPAMGKLGEMYQYGYGTDNNYDLAEHWYRMGATAGDGRSAFRLGWLYHHGKINGKFDELTARKYYSIAAHTDYRDNLGIIDIFINTGTAMF